jgi:hypothetical protein
MPTNVVVGIIGEYLMSQNIPSQKRGWILHLLLKPERERERVIYFILAIICSSVFHDNQPNCNDYRVGALVILPLYMITFHYNSKYLANPKQSFVCSSPLVLLGLNRIFVMLYIIKFRGCLFRLHFHWVHPNANSVSK